MKTIAFYNQKGGVGKTSLAVNYAYLCARAGQRTLLWDLDPQASATYIMRVNEKLAPKTKDILAKSFELEDLAVRSNFENLHVVPAATRLRLLSEKIFESSKSSEVIERATRSARSTFDIVVIDSPPSLNALSDSVLGAIDLLCIPLQPSALSIHSLDSLTTHLGDDSLLSRSVAIYNMVDMRRITHRRAVEEREASKKIKLLEVSIPYSADMEKMATDRNPFFVLQSRSKVGPALESMYQELTKLLYLSTKQGKSSK